jgi:hypothetical protein
MHPGPVNRGVELSGEVVDSPQAVITAQVEAGVVVRMAVLYELLGQAAREAPAAAGRGQRRQAARVSATKPLVRAGSPANSCCATCTCSTRAKASTRATTCACATGRSPSSARRLGRSRRLRRRGADRGERAPAAAAGVLRPARAPAHARAGAQGGPGDGHSRGRRRRLRGRDRDAEHRPGARLGAAAALAARRGGARGARPGRLSAGDHARPAPASS